MLKNKKGVVDDLLWVFVGLFVFGIVATLVISVWSSFVDQTNALDSDIASDHVKSQIVDLGKNIFFLDELFVILFIVLWAGLLITSASTGQSHPALFFVFLLFVIILTGVSMIFSNFFEMFSTNTGLLNAGEHIGSMNFFFTFYPIITFIVSLISGIIFYSKSGKSIGGDGGSYE